MAAIVRYRTGRDRVTGRLLRGRAHLAQSLAVIWTTRTNQRLLLLEFGSDIRARLGEDITPALVLDLYDELVTTAHRWEPEYRISNLQLGPPDPRRQPRPQARRQLLPARPFRRLFARQDFGTTSPLAGLEALGRANARAAA